MGSAAIIIRAVSGWFRFYGFAGVLDRLLIGAYPLDADDVEMLARLGVTRVLNLVEDNEYGPGERDAVVQALMASGLDERRVAFVDHGSLPPDSLEAAVSDVDRWLADGLYCYVHCRAGRHRSAAVAAGVVAVREGKDIDEALAYVQARKPAAELLPKQHEDLHLWWRTRVRSNAVRSAPRPGTNTRAG